MDSRVATVIECMDATLNKNLPFEELAKSVNLSSSRLRHLFKNEVGMSPRKYLRTIRMEQAKKLIESTYLNVKEVMNRVGVNDESHFVRDFERNFGLTPARHRKHYQAGYQRQKTMGHGA